MTNVALLAEELKRRAISTDRVAVVRRWCPLEPTERQIKVINADAREIALIGGAGSAKSTAALMAVLCFVEKPEYRALVLRRQLTDAKLAHGLADILKSWSVVKGARWDGVRNAVVFPSGAEIHVGYLKAPNDVYRYQGTEWHAVLYDEGTHFPEVSYTYLFSRTGRTKSNIPPRMLLCANPDGPYTKWVRERFVTNRAPEVFYEFSTYLDNPFIDHANYAQQLARLDPLQRARLERGEWVLGGAGSVFQVRPELFVDHTVLPAASEWRTVLGIDLGASQAKPTTAFTVCMFSPHDPTVYVVKSYKLAGMMPSSIAEEIHRLGSDFDFQRIIIDAGGLGAGYVEELTARYGLPAEAAKKQQRYQWVSYLIGDTVADPPRVRLVSGRATEQLVEEMEELRWDEAGREYDKNAVDHCCDSLLYAWRWCRHFGAEERERSWRDMSPEERAQQEEARMEAALDEQLARRKELGF